MKELSLKKLENLEGGRMFGTTCSTQYIGAGQCMTTCVTRFLWIRTDVENTIFSC